MCVWKWSTKNYQWGEHVLLDIFHHSCRGYSYIPTYWGLNSHGSTVGSGCDCGKEVARTVPSCSRGGRHGRAETNHVAICFFLSSSCNMRFSHLNQIIYIMCFFPHITTGFSYFNRTCTYIHVVIFFPIVMIAYLSMRASNLGSFHCYGRLLAGRWTSNDNWPWMLEGL